MLPDIEFPTNKWTNLNEKAGIPEGTALLIVNKSPGREIYIWEGTEPEAGSTHGIIGLYARRVMIQAGTGPVWVLDKFPAYNTMGRVSVQVAK